MTTQIPKKLNQVIVIGGGLAGLTAANTLIEYGVNVTLVDKSPYCGGNSTKATSGINGAQTATQKNLKINDTNEIFLNDTIKGGAQIKELAKTLCYESGPCVDWLVNEFDLDLSLVARLGGHSMPRTHRGKERFPGMTITTALLDMFEAICQKHPTKGKLLNKARATEILFDKTTKTVYGIKYIKDDVENQLHGSVIIATGGFGADFDANSLLAEYRPDLMHLPTTNGAHCTGDGIKMCLKLAKCIDLDQVQVHPTGLVNPEKPDVKVKLLAAEALRGEGGILIDALGKRFCNELGRRDYVSNEMWKNQKPFRLILNSKASTAIQWHCKHYAGRGVMKKFPSGYHLAREMGIDPKLLERTFNSYNEIAKKTEKDPEGGSYDAYPSGKSWDEFGKKFFHNYPFDMNDEFNVAIVTPVIHYCMGGLLIDTVSRVQGLDGKIRGLYAAGEVAGGVHGCNRLGGNSLLDCVVFGIVAGRHCAEDLYNTNQKKNRLKELAGRMTTNLPTVKQDIKPTMKQDDRTPMLLTAHEVSKRNNSKACWVIINDEVLDVTKFMHEHPGGVEAILDFAGKDATQAFNDIHPEGTVKKYASHCILGKLHRGGPSEDPVIPSSVPSGLTAPLLSNEPTEGLPGQHWWGPARNTSSEYGPLGPSISSYFKTCFYLIVLFIKEVCYTIFSSAQLRGGAATDKSGLTRSAVFLAVFVVIHGLGNLHIFVGPDAFNGYGYFLNHPVPWGTLLLPVEIYLLAAGLLHVFVGTMRTLKFKKLSLLKDSNRRGELQMAISGSLLFIFLCVHLTQFRFVNNPDKYTFRSKWMYPFYCDPSDTSCETATFKDLYKLEFQLFESLPWVAFYVGCIYFFVTHMSKGLEKVVNASAYVPRAHKTKAIFLATCVSWFVALCYFSFPIYCYCFPVRDWNAYTEKHVTAWEKVNPN